MRGTVLLMLCWALLSGCYRHVISEEARRTVEPGLTFPALQADPKQYAGKQVILGGMIVSVKNGKDGSQLELLHTPLGTSEEPLIHQKGGRFLAVTPDFLDPMVYRKNRYVTLFGQVEGEKKKPVDEYEYTYPVILIRELYLWDEAQLEEPPPRWYYDPYPYPYPYDPFWYRPYWRPWGPWGW